MERPFLGHYVILDPIARSDSGISTYTELAARRLRMIGMPVKQLSRLPRESIKQFRRRVASEIITHAATIRCVEAPETLACSALIPDGIPLHIRLHCSRSLGALIQGMRVDRQQVRLEQREISRANYVSAPSHAAVLGSQLLYSMERQPHVYPNPSPTYEPSQKNRTSPRYDVLFIGRHHYLKGIHFLYEAAHRLPTLRFGMVLPDSSTVTKPLPSNIEPLQANGPDKAEVYRSAKLVLIPSMFETASMVGLEAIASGVPVVTWSHVGLAEYGIPLVVPVAPNNVPALCAAILAQCRQSPIKHTNREFDSVNVRFDKGITGTLKGASSINLTTQPPEEAIIYLSNLSRTNRTAMNLTTASRSPYARKFRKLRRNPIGFLRDARIVRILFGSNNEKPRAPVAPLPQPHAGNQPAIAPQDLQPSSRTPPLFTQIPRTGKIEFRDAPDKPTGMVTSLLFPAGFPVEMTEDLLSRLDSYPDFRYVGRERLQVGSFDVNSEEPTLSLLNRIDLANKHRLATLSNLILVDPPPNLCKALRSCGSQLRVITIHQRRDSLPDRDSTDAVICVGDQFPLDAARYRRRLDINSWAGLHDAIRRVIQEGSPRNPDMLLPLFNCTAYRPDEFLNFRSQYFQGIIYIRTQQYADWQNLKDLYVKISENIESIAILESVYMRYRSLCEAIETSADLAEFLECSLLDGAIFDVRNSH